MLPRSPNRDKGQNLLHSLYLPAVWSLKDQSVRVKVGPSVSSAEMFVPRLGAGWP